MINPGVQARVLRDIYKGKPLSSTGFAVYQKLGFSHSITRSLGMDTRPRRGLLSAWAFSNNIHLTIKDTFSVDRLLHRSLAHAIQ